MAPLASNRYVKVVTGGTRRLPTLAFLLKNLPHLVTQEVFVLTIAISLKLLEKVSKEDIQ